MKRVIGEREAILRKHMQELDMAQDGGTPPPDLYPRSEKMIPEGMLQQELVRQKIEGPKGHHSIVCVTGYPLAGKTTIASSLAKLYGARYFSTGDYARMRGMDPMEESIKRRGLSLSLNEEIVQQVVSECIAADRLVIDGFPRSYEQVLAVESFDPFILFLWADPATILQRMAQRGRQDDVIEIVGAKVEASLRLWYKIQDTDLECEKVQNLEEAKGCCEKLWGGLSSGR